MRCSATHLLIVLPALLALIRPCTAQEADTSSTLIAALDTAIFSNDDKAIEAAHQPILDRIEKQPNDYTMQLAAARGYVARADLLRIDRHTGKLDGETNRKHRAQQAAWGAAAADHAAQALTGAKTDHEKSEAHRLRAEAMVHRIDGPLAGLQFGPVAKAEVTVALELEPGNLEAVRAQGLMFLHNPPINGGDLDKAVETFTRCAKEKDSDVARALLAQAWFKKQRPERASLEVARSLKLNPNNRLALNLKARLTERDEAQNNQQGNRS